MIRWTLVLILCFIGYLACLVDWKEFLRMNHLPTSRQDLISATDTNSPFYFLRQIQTNETQTNVFFYLVDRKDDMVYRLVPVGNAH